jgi:hypothetical protein
MRISTQLIALLRGLLLKHRRFACGLVVLCNPRLEPDIVDKLRYLCAGLARATAT